MIFGVFLPAKTRKIQSLNVTQSVLLEYVNIHMKKMSLDIYNSIYNMKLNLNSKFEISYRPNHTTKISGGKHKLISSQAKNS